MCSTIAVSAMVIVLGVAVKGRYVAKRSIFEQMWSLAPLSTIYVE